MSQQTITGGCHCGAVRFSAEIDPSAVMMCDCSHCAKLGWVLTFVPQERFTLIQGEDQLADYQFNKRVIHHFFCKTCGVKSFSQGIDEAGNKTFAINLRCADDFPLDTLTPPVYPGKNL